MKIQKIQKTLWLSAISILVLSLVGVILIAQEGAVHQAWQNRLETTPRIPEYYLGIQCTPIPALLSEHLELGGKGLLIQKIVPGSPADKTGIKHGDILLKMGVKDIKTMTDIFAVLEEEQDEEQTVIVLQKGKQTELKITPEKRPETPAAPGRDIVIGGNNAERFPGQFHRFFDRMENPGVPAEMFTPNAKIERFEVRVMQGGDLESQRIVVRHNDDTWEIEKIEDLPDDIQEKVRKMIVPNNDLLNRPSNAWKIFHQGTWEDFDEMEAEMQKIFETIPSLQQRFENHRKIMEEHFRSLW